MAGRRVSEELGKGVKDSSCGLFQPLTGGTEKNLRIGSILAKIQAKHLLNTNIDLTSSLTCLVIS